MQAEKGHLAYPQTGLCRNPCMGFFQSFVVSLFSMTRSKSAAPLRRHFWSSSNSEFSFFTSSSVLSSSSLKKNHIYCFCYFIVFVYAVGLVIKVRIFWEGQKISKLYRTVTELTILTSLINGEAWENGEDGKFTVLVGKETFSIYYMKIRGW